MENRQHINRNDGAFDNIQESLEADLSTNEGIISELPNNELASLISHNNNYSNLLTVYVNNAAAQLEFKCGARKVVFCILILSYILLTFTFFNIALNGKYDDMNQVIVSLVSFITAIIGIPMVIVKYLFNPDEEKNLADIIKNMQKHDRHIRKKVNK